MDVLTWLAIYSNAHQHLISHLRTNQGVFWFGFSVTWLLLKINTEGSELNSFFIDIPSYKFLVSQTTESREVSIAKSPSIYDNSLVKNNKGPSIEPCENLALTAAHLETCPF